MGKRGIIAHYGEDRKVILALDNAGPHPEDLGLRSDQIVVKFPPPNTTPIIQPMDQGVIYCFKRAYMNIYYDKMMDHVMRQPDKDDPIEAFSKTFTIKDSIYDIAKAWDSIGIPLIHKCFESLLSPVDYVKEYNGIYNRNEDWDGIIFRGFSLINDPRMLQLRQL